MKIHSGLLNLLNVYRATDRVIVIDIGHSCELAERHQISEVYIMMLSFQTALLLRLFSLKRQFYTNSDDDNFFHHKVSFHIPRKSHSEAHNIQNRLMALPLGVSETDVQQCFWAWHTGNPCVQMEGKYTEWDHTLSKHVLLLPKYRMTLVTTMTPLHNLRCSGKC